MGCWGNPGKSLTWCGPKCLFFPPIFLTVLVLDMGSKDMYYFFCFSSQCMPHVCLHICSPMDKAKLYLEISRKKKSVSWIIFLILLWVFLNWSDVKMVSFETCVCVCICIRASIAIWQSTLLPVMLTSHRDIGLNPCCSISDPVPCWCAWEANESTWALAPMRETLIEFQATYCGFAQPWHLWLFQWSTSGRRSSCSISL